MTEQEAASTEVTTEAAPQTEAAKETLNTSFEGSAFSYDDIVSHTSQAEVTEKPAAKEKPPAEVEGEEPAESEEAEGSEAPADEEKPKAEVKDTEAKAAASTTLKFKTKDGKEIEIPDDAKVTKKIDGKEVEVSIAEALKEYAGHVPWQKRLEEVSVQKKELAKKEQEVQQRAAKLEQDTELIAQDIGLEINLLGEDKIEDFVFNFAANRQLDPTKVDSRLRRHYFKQFKDAFDLDVDEDTINHLDSSRANEYANRELNVLRQQRQTQAVQGDIQQFAQKVFSDAGCTEAEWKEAKSLMDAEYRKQFGHLPDLTKTDPAKAREYVKQIGNVARSASIQNAAFRTVDEVAPNLADTDPDLRKELANIAFRFRDYDPEEVKATLKEALGKSKATDEAVPLTDDELKARPKTALSSDDDNDVFERARKQVEENPLSVYD